MYRLMIIEDDAGIAGAVAGYAASWDFEIRCAENFRNIVGEFAEFQPHIVLLDISLPFFNGYHCAERYARCQTCPSFSSPRHPTT